jgi:hypothetical protein
MVDIFILAIHLVQIHSFSEHLHAGNQKLNHAEKEKASM